MINKQILYEEESQTEDSEANKSKPKKYNLDAGSLMQDNHQPNYSMNDQLIRLRRRKGDGKYLSADETLALLQTAFQTNHLSTSGQDYVSDQTHPSPPNHKRKRESAGSLRHFEKGDKIFSLTEYMTIMACIMILVGMIFLCACSKTSLMVSAHFSGANTGNHNPTMGNNESNYSHRVKPSNTHNMSASTSTNYIPPIPAPAMMASNTINTQVVARQEYPSDFDGWRRQETSIDRFDSGEPIAPIPPIAQASHSTHPDIQQRSSFPDDSLIKKPTSATLNSANLQVAASQDSYMTPQERDQLMRSQEQHYGGGGEGYERSQSQADNYPNGYSRPVQQSRHERQGEGHNQATLSANRLDSRSYLPTEESNFRRPLPGSSGYSPIDSEGDEADEDDETGGPNPKKYIQVPENRRVTASGSVNYKQHGQLDDRFNNQNNDENDPREDYGGANDDMYFSRKSNAGSEYPGASVSKSNLNTKSNPIHNQNQRQFSAGRYDNLVDDGRNQNQGNMEESNGFGPGPNEAYLVDRAESANMAAGRSSDLDEDNLYPNVASDPGIDPSGTDSEDNRYPEGGPMSRAASSIGTRRDLRPTISAGDSRPSAENADYSEDSDSGEDSGPVFAPSSTSNVKSRAPAPAKITHSTGLGNLKNPPRQQPSASTRQIPQSLKVQKNDRPPQNYYGSSRGPQKSDHQTSTRSSPHSEISLQLEQQRLVKGDKSTTSKSHTAKPQMNSVSSKINQAPYNPQDNPSHAGKYFIN